ncbi:TonB-dependent receptor domain-containing protein [Undibacterium macrobrachii]|uniref:TonB-dependent receptor domain-containing protein n=1 Tax=Undibacterium macrobrachii TaxID=1119058 RepID=UPI0027E3EEC0|nr:TonB-dependent receptor [Undibacterium macrobrachii]
MVITGSRIRSKEFTDTSPVQILTAERSFAAGLTTAAEILQNSTIAASSDQIDNGRFSTSIREGGAGINTVALRGLGSGRTLVLLNGRRLPPSGVGSSVSPVDLGSLPSLLTSRYEILTDGASSIYGSDAIAGVTNAITQRGFDGVKISASGNRNIEGGGGGERIGILWGKRFDAGSIAIAASTNNTRALEFNDRKSLSCPEAFYYRNDGSRADIVEPDGSYRCVGNATYGYLSVYNRNPNGTVAFKGYRVPGGSNVAGEPATYGTTDIFPRNHPAPLSGNAYQPAKNHNIFATMEYSPSWLNGAEVYAELLSNRRNSEQDYWYQFFGLISEKSPVNPYKAQGNPVYAYGFYNVLGEQRVDLNRLVTGVRGNLGSWDWDAYISHSHSDGHYSNVVGIADRINHGTGIDQKTNRFIGDGVPCGPGAPAGCIPFDLTSGSRVSDGVIPKDVADYFFTKARGNTVYQQSIAEVSANGHLLTLPAGQVGAAFGVSARRDAINDDPGELSRAGNLWARTTVGITKGSDVLSEAFGEVTAPLLKNHMFAKNLDLTASGRFSHYKLTGNGKTFKLGLNWGLNDSFRIRSTRGTSFRAPRLYELFLANQTSFSSQSSIDPCIRYDEMKAGEYVKSEIVRKNCALDGLPGNLEASGSSVLVTTGGGTHLKPETSVSTTYGFIFTPVNTNFKFAVDFWDIKIRNQISALGSGLVSQCYSQAEFRSDPICNLFKRVPDGDRRITDVNASYGNIEKQSTKGIDFTVAYSKKLDIGTFGLTMNATHTKENLYQRFRNGESKDRTGLFGNPKLVANTQLSFTRDAWTAYWSTYYTGPTSYNGREGYSQGVNATEYNGTPFTYNGGPARYALDIPSFMTHTLSVSHRAKTWSINVGIANVFNQSAPTLSAQSSRFGSNAAFGQYYYGLLGRQIFMSFNQTFK